MGNEWSGFDDLASHLENSVRQVASQGVTSQLAEFLAMQAYDRGLTRADSVPLPEVIVNGMDGIVPDEAEARLQANSILQRGESLYTARLLEGEEPLHHRTWTVGGRYREIITLAIDGQDKSWHLRPGELSESPLYDMA